MSAIGVKIWIDDIQLKRVESINYDGVDHLSVKCDYTFIPQREHTIRIEILDYKLILNTVFGHDVFENELLFKLTKESAHLLTGVDEYEM